jgi:hypothetical protein
MTPRTGLYAALAGLVLAAMCATPLLLLADHDPAGDDAILGTVFLGLGTLLGLTVMMVGLIMAVIKAATKHRVLLPSPRSVVRSTSRPLFTRTKEKNDGRHNQPRHQH